MRRNQWTVVACLMASAALGCNAGPSRRTLASSEPALSDPASDAEVAIVDRAKPVAVENDPAVDRHPLLSKPLEYYDKTDSNKVVKTAAAAFIGVPAGIFGEIKQAIVGVPSASREN